MLENEAKEKQITEDLSAVLKEAKRMGCRKVGYIRDIPLENVELVIKALEEVQQYRAIGTPDQCGKVMDIVKAMIEREMNIEDIEGYMKFEDELVQQGYTFSSLLEAREKMKPIKPVLESEKRNICPEIYTCPSCGGLFAGREIAKYCYHCGQRVDWGTED